MRGCLRQPRSPAFVRIDRKRNSVDLLPTDRTLDMIRERSALVNESATSPDLDADAWGTALRHPALVVQLK